MRLVAPDLSSRRARLADWLELEALTNARGQAAVSAIRTQVRRASDDRASPADIDAGADTEGEPEITDRLSDDLEEKLFEELSLRQASIGDAYPFELITGAAGRAHLLRLRGTWDKAASGELIYVFCLLDSGIREGLVTYPVSAKPLVQTIGNIFQICSCIAVGGYTSAEVVSFGFPRATGNGFLAALQAVWDRYGSYKVYNAVPYGFDDRLKDGGVDIIAWRHFADKYAATFIMFVQVASGLDWKDKEVSGDVRSLRKWFDGPAFDHFLPAICIPFPLWFDMDEPTKGPTGKKQSFIEGVRTRYVVREGKFGIVFDRGRIALSCALALRTAAGIDGLPYPVDGLDRIDEVEAWVRDALSRLGEIRADA